MNRAQTHPEQIVLVAGATGLVGRECLRLMANDPEVKEARALVRRPLPPPCRGERILECRTDFEQLVSHADWFRVDRVICALGTTMRKAGSREAFRHADFDYPLTIAKLALEGGASHFLLVSAMGANPRSPIFYYRVKGELEEAIRALGYPSVTIARPSLLLGGREEFRPGENMAKAMAWLLPARWRPVHASQVAAALARAAQSPIFGVLILENGILRTYERPASGNIPLP